MLTKKIKSDLKKIISGKDNENKWPSLKAYIADVIKEKPTDISLEELRVELGKEVAAIILDELSIIRQTRSSFSGMLRSKASSQEKVKEFMEGLNDFAQKTDDSVDVDFSEVLRQIIVNMIVSCVNKKLWLNASDMIDVFNYPIIRNSPELKKIRIDPLDQDLINAIKFINKLDLGALSYSAQIYSVSQYQANLPANNSEANKSEINKFLKNLEDIKLRIRIGLSWSLTTLTGGAKDGLKLYGSVNLEQDGVNSDVVSKHSQVMEVLNLMNSQQQSERMQYLASLHPAIDAESMQKILAKADEDIKTMDVFNRDINQFTNKKFLKKPGSLLISLSTVTTSDVDDDHAITFAFWDDKVLFFNRIGSNPGLKVFKVNDDTREIFFSLAVGKPSYDTVMSHLKNLKSLAEIPMKAQKRGVGNCAWVAAKGAYLISVYVNALRLGNDHAASASIARDCYKYFSNQKRILDIEKYMDGDFPNKDDRLLAHVSLKMQTESWVMRGMKPLTARFSKKVHDETDSILIVKLLKTIEAADMFNFNKLFYVLLSNTTIPSQKHLELFETAVKSCLDTHKDDGLFEQCQGIVEEFLNKDTAMISFLDADRLVIETVDKIEPQVKETDLFKTRLDLLRAAVDKRQEPKNQEGEEEKRPSITTKRPSIS